MLLPLLLCILPTSSVSAMQDAGFDANARQRVVAALSTELTANYVFQEKAQVMAEALRQHEANGAYDKAESGQQFAEMLTHDLAEIAHDAHLVVRFHPVASPPPNDGSARVDDDTEVHGKREPVPADLKHVDCRPGKAHYFYFGSVECLPGNIGYLEVYSFPERNEALDVMGAAMTQIARADALIVDLRENGGGDPRMVALMVSYLFDEPTHINDIYRRKNNRTEEYWTSLDVPGIRFGQRKDVYVLVGPRTPSAAEDFSYDLKTLHRATIIGESTWGGANPGNFVWLDDHFDAFIPTGSSINPITKTNWEGVGVTPDVAVSTYVALEVAEEMALKKLIADPKNRRVAQLQKRLEERVVLAQAGVVAEGAGKGIDHLVWGNLLGLCGDGEAGCCEQGECLLHDVQYEFCRPGRVPAW